MSAFSKLYAFLFTTTFTTAFAATCTGEWQGLPSPANDWSIATNWSNDCVPLVAGDSAFFGLNGTTTVDLDIDVTLTNFTFDNPTQNYFIVPSAGQVITMSSFEGIQPTLTVSAGSQAELAPLGINMGDTLLFTTDGFITTGTGLLPTPGNLILQGTGTLQSSFSIAVNDLVINSGTLLNTSLTVGTSLTSINGGTVLNLSQFLDLSPLIMNGGALENLATTVASSFTMNDGFVQNNGEIFATEFTLNNGIFDNNSIGSPGTFSVSGDIVMNGGALFNETGSSIISSTTFTMNEGTVVNFTGSGPISVINDITVNGGFFKNNGIVASNTSTVVNSPGVVTGIGNFFGPFINNGTVIPGDQPGDLSFSSYTQTAAGNLQINILNSSVFGSITSMSTASLDGTLTVAPFSGFSGYAPGTPLTIVTAVDGVTGTFSHIVDLFANATAQVTYFPDTVILELFPVLTSFVSFKEATFSTLNQINLLLLNHMDRMIDPCDCCDSPRFQLYADPFGSVGRVCSRSGFSGYHFDTAGVLVGFDALFGNYGMGVAFDYDRIYARGVRNFGHFESDKYHFSGYGTYQATQSLRFDAIVGGGWERNRLDRTSGFFDEQIAKATPNGSFFDAVLAAEYLFNICEFNIIPVADLQYIYYKIDRFHENNSIFFDYAYNSQNYNSLRSLLGLKLNRSFCLGSFEIIPQVNAAWQYECLDQRRTLSATNITLALPTTLLTPNSTRNILLVGADVELLYDRFSLDLSYEYEGNRRYSNNFFYLELAAKF